jgi:predicted ArsR family transcriptional regulator
LSTSEAAKELGINADTVRAAVNELIEKDYLVEVELYPNLTGYLFIESGDGGERK